MTHWCVWHDSSCHACVASLILRQDSLRFVNESRHTSTNHVTTLNGLRHAYRRIMSHTSHKVFGKSLRFVAWLVNMCDVPRHTMCVLTRWYVWHDPLRCVTWFVDMRDVTHWGLWHDSSMCDLTHWGVWHDSSYQAGLQGTGAAACVWREYVWRYSLRCVTWLVIPDGAAVNWSCRMCVMTRWYKWNDFLKCVTPNDLLYIYVWHEMTYCHVWHDWIWITCLIYMCGMTPWNVWHETTYYIYMCDTKWLIIYICVTWNDLLTCETRLVNMSYMPHLYVWHDCRDSWWLVDTSGMTSWNVWHQMTDYIHMCDTKWLIEMWDTTRHLYVWHDCRDSTYLFGRVCVTHIDEACSSYSRVVSHMSISHDMTAVIQHTCLGYRGLELLCLCGPVRANGWPWVHVEFVASA